MSETFNTTFTAGQSATGLLLGSSFTGTNIASGLQAVTVNGNIDQPGSQVTIDSSLAGLVGTGLTGTYIGFNTPVGSNESTYYFSVTLANLPTPVALAVTKNATTNLALAQSINTTATSAPDSPSIACYVTGTLIRTVTGDVAVEDLAIGDLVVTASGEHRPIKWIGTRAYARRFARANPELLPICFAAGSLSDGVPTRDLRVSPKHAMFLDGCLIPAERLVNGVSIFKESHATDVTYFHIELDSHDALIAEGAASESFVDDESRGIFHNAHTFRMLYPGERREEAVYCAPRVEGGHVLQAVRRRLAERAGLSVVQAPVLGDLRGNLDGCDGSVVWGWAQSLAYPDAPVCLEVLVDGIATGLVYAEDYRTDLTEAGIGDGCHAFRLRLAQPLSGETVHTLTIRRAADGATLNSLSWSKPTLRAAA